MLEIAEKIILALVLESAPSADTLGAVIRRILRTQTKNAGAPRKSDLLKAYHKLLSLGKIKKSVQIEKLLTKRAVRTLSGVAIVTVLTRPYPCPGKCVYCPNEKNMPKSYLADEPAAARALALEFDPYQQVQSRLDTLSNNGHPTDKIELIVKGGSWSAYPLDYQYWFIGQCFAAANGQKNNNPKPVANIVTLRQKLATAKKKNETGLSRIVGLTLETRPDCINLKTIKIMRELGCTRLEIGVQTTDDKVLKIIERGHDTHSVKTATALLKNWGFKVDYHLMPQLPTTTPARDLRMLRSVFSDPDYRPDMIKIYPCTVTAHTKLYRWLKTGRYRPYADKHLIRILQIFKTEVPRYVRISRLIRDIPAHHIKAGNTVTNLRQVIKDGMEKRGWRCQCLRCREVGHQPLNKRRIKMFTEQYPAGGGQEYFLSWEDTKRQVVYAFCRLRIATSPDAPYPAFIRELHTYGQTLNIGTKEKSASQHTGLGKKLLKAAEHIAALQGAQYLAVIAGVGVRDYYRRQGYRLTNEYMVKKLRSDYNK